MTEKQLQYHRNWRLANQEKVRAATRRYYHQHKERRRAVARARDAATRAENPERLRMKDRQYARNNPGYIKAKGIRSYGISVVRWLWLFEFQGRRCAICRAPDPGTRGWATDHDHETGEVRGLLCHRCNLCLGWLGDSSAVVAARLGRIGLYLLPPKPRGGDRAADASDRLIPWEPKAV